MNTTTRKYSRTMAEAFPHGPEYACAVERYSRPITADKAVAWVCAMGFLVVVVMLIAEAI